MRALLLLLLAVATLRTAAADVEVVTAAPSRPVAEDADFDPYTEQTAPLIEPVAAERREEREAAYAPKNRHVETFDFDPSEGLTFFVAAGERECFFQDAKSVGDALGGAYVVSSADSHIDLEVKNPEGATIYRRLGDAEGQYEVHPSMAGVHELCFINSDSDGKLVTHVTKTLQSQHPVEREHVSVLAKYASHLDIRLGELESEQRLHQIRTERHIKVEETTSKRVSFYGTLECVVYLLVCFFQVYYIKSLLDNPSKARTWA
ncbi:hypothetical protein PybrP1_003265 [[Pythium] brassicae (nom. inval.)]|nr:hypothetical protein PybrP1_003265 [[Pythium] brassicae (nom. inval.)]